MKSGTLHPILGRLEQVGLVESYWEEPSAHEDQGRPRRRYYRFAPGGAEAARLAIAEPDANSSSSVVGRFRSRPAF